MGEARTETRYDAAVVATMPYVAAALFLLYLVLAAVYPFLLPGRQALTLSAAAGFSAAGFAVLAWLASRAKLEASLAHPVAVAVVVVVSANAVLHMCVSGEPRHTTMVMLAVVGAGAALVSLRWLIGTLYAVWMGWLAGAAVVGADDRWVHYAASLIAATGLSVLVNVLRRQALDALFAARDVADAAAVRDELTGLANRRGLAMLGAQIVEHARRQGDAVHCVFVDVDHLKVVNEELGSESGDAVLSAVADALRTVTRATDVVARWSGDQFCVVGPGPGMAPMELERRVQMRVAEHSPVPPEVWTPKVSAGGAMLAPWDSGSLDTLLGKADQEMYLRRALRRESAQPSEAASPSE